MSIDSRKVVVVGCGFVGSSSAFALMQSKLFSEMVLIDADHDRAEGEAMDISHGMAFASPMKIYAGSYDDITDAAVIVITAGANQKPDETRLDLIRKNSAIMKSIIGEIKKRPFEGILLIVSNPVDILTYIALKESGYPANRVIGSGTVLDTGRFRYELGEHLEVDSRSIHAFIIGEHGDSELAAWSEARVGGMPIHDFCELRGHYDHEASMEKIFNSVKNSAIMKSIIGEIKKRPFEGILLIVSNPVDILTYIALKESGYPANRVIGSGTVLDTGRFRYELGEHLGVDSRSIHAFIIGEHGDSELAAWSEARVGGMPINDFCELRGHYDHESSMEKIFNSVKNSAYEIIARKHATYYGIAMAVCRICAAIVRNEQSILPVSSLMTGEYGLENVVLSIPAVVDENGIETVVPIELNEKELAELQKSSEVLKKVIAEFYPD